MSNVAPLRGPLSIQGEERVALDTAVFMDQGEVDEYVSQASEAILECRERGRHFYPKTRPGAPLVFVDVTDNGLLVRELECTICGCAVRVELWEAVRRGRATRYRPVANHTTYRRNPNGDQYVAPAGRGRMTAKQVREALATSAMQGVRPAELKRQILAEKARRERRAATERDDLAPRFHAG